MKAAKSWSHAGAVVLMWFAAAVQAQQPPHREGSLQEITLAPDDAAAQPVVGLIRAVFDALQRRDEAAVLALYEPPPAGMSALSQPRFLEARRFAVWRHLKRGELSNHRLQPIRTGANFRSGQWVSTDHFSIVVDSESDSEIGPNLQTRKVISNFQVRRLKDGQYRLSQMELIQ